MKDNEIKRIPLSVRVREDLVLRLDDKIKELHTRQDRWSKQRVLDGLLEDWLGGKRTIDMAPPPAASKGISEDLAALQSVLEEATPEQRQNARNMIRLLADTIRSRPQNPSHSGRAPKPKKKVG